MAFDYAKLKAEVVGDPLGYGYATMDDAAVAAKLKTVARTKKRAIIPAYEVFEALDPGELAALSTAHRMIVLGMLAMGEINLRGANTRAMLKAAFVAGTKSRAALIALQTEPISRENELGLWEIKPADIASARMM